MSATSPSLGAQASRSIGWIVLERWSSRITMLLVFAVLGRLLPPAAFGLISLATVFSAIMRVFVDSGFTKSLIRRTTVTRTDASTAFWTSLGIAVVLYALLFVLAPLISVWLGEPHLTPVLRWLGLSLPISALSMTPAALLERDFGFRTLSIRQFTGTMIGSVAAVTAALLGAGVWALVIQTLGTSVAAVATLWASTEWRPSFAFSVQSLRELASTGIGILGVELLDAIQANIDKLLIGAFFSAEVLGYYFLAQRVGTILVELVTAVIARVSLTTFSKVQHDVPRLNRVLRQLTFVAMSAGIPVFGLFAALSPQIVPLAFGPNWGPSIPLLWILAPSWAMAAVMYFDRSVFIATGHAMTALTTSLLQNVVGVALVFLLVPFGTAGVAASRSARLVVWPWRLHSLRRLAGIRIGSYMLQPVRCLAAIAPVIVAIVLLQATPWAAAPVPVLTFALPLVLVGLPVYAGLLWLLAGDENRIVLRRAVRTAVGRLPIRRLATA